jgi:hypothetical protein
MLTRGIDARVPPRPIDRGHHYRPGRYDDVVRDTKVASDHCRASDHATCTDPCAARDTHATRDTGVRPDVNVMTHLDLIVELGPVFDHGVCHRSPVDGRVGADIDIVADEHSADVRHLQPAPLFQCTTESVSTDHCASVYYGTCPDLTVRIYRDITVQPGVVTDPNVRADTASRADSHPFPDSGPLFDGDERADLSRSGHIRLRMYAGHRVDARLNHRVRVEQCRDAHEISVGICSADERSPRHRNARLYYHSASLRLRQRASVRLAAEEGNVLGPRGIERRDLRNRLGGITREFSAQKPH